MSPSNSSSSRSQFVLFEVGRANVGDARQRLPMRELLKEWNALLAPEGIRLTGSVGHTGNYIAEAQAITSQQIADAFRRIRIKVAVFTAEEFLAWVAVALRAFSEPSSAPPGRRPTPGVAMNLDAEGGVPPGFSSSERVISAPFAVHRVRGVWKLDVLRADGKALDRTKREGGWGSVAEAMRRQAGGEWTARSMRTIERLSGRLFPYNCARVGSR